MRIVRSAAWVCVLVLGAVAIAGLIISLDHPESGDGRPELVAQDAAVLAPRLTLIEPSLERLAGASDALSAAVRAVLAALRSGDGAALSAARAEGDAALVQLQAAAAPVRDAAPGLLAGLDDGTRLPTDDLVRVAAIPDVVAGVEAMAAAWQEAIAATWLPARVGSAVAAHTASVERASAAGRDGRYADALAQLAAATDARIGLVELRADAAAEGRTVDRLDGFLQRLQDREGALAVLYTELARSGGARTRRAEEALVAAQAAEQALGTTVADLSLIADDLGAGEVTTALLTIEDARGAIAAALGGS